MNPRDAEMLLGGYAAGILTDDERSALFSLALDNQALFDALADEESLRALMADPRARAELLRAVTAGATEPDSQSEPEFSYARRAMMPAQAPSPLPPSRESWWRKLLRPAPVAGIGAVALAAIGLVFVLRPGEDASSKTQTVAKVSESVSSAIPDQPPSGQQIGGQPPSPIVRPQPAEQRPTVGPGPRINRPADADRARKAGPAEMDERENRIRDRGAPAEPVVETPRPAAAPLASTPGAPPPAPVSTDSERRQRSAEAVRVESRKEEPAVPGSAVGGAASGRLSTMQKSTNLAAQPAPALPYRLERDSRPASGFRFPRGARVRVIVTAPSDGTLTAVVDGIAAEPVRVRGGRTYPVPPRAYLKSESGQREVVLTFQPAQGAARTAALRIEFE